MTGRVQKIQLENDLSYKEKEFDFNALLLYMLTSSEGTEGCIKYSIEKTVKGYNLKRISSGIRFSLKDRDRGDKKEDYNLVISSGTYSFEEYPDLSEEQILRKTLSDILGTRGKDEIYIRIYKKNSLECVMQAFRPI